MKSHYKFRRLFASVVAAGAILGGGLVATPASAAVGANCTAKTESRSTTLATEWRTKITCSSINSGTKVRGKLVLVALPDSFTAWFTDKNSAKYTMWRAKIPLTANPKAGYEVAPK